MASPVVRVVFEDGHVEEAKLNPRCLIEAERHFKGEMPRIESTLYAAWFRLGRPGVFDEWLDTIERIDETEAADEPTPFDPAVSDGS